MFISRFLTAFFASMVLSATAYAGNSVTMGADNGNISVTVMLLAKTRVAQRFVDALLKTPSVKEVNNLYVEPGTLYHGPGFQLELEKVHPVYVTFTIQLPAADQASAVNTGSFVRMTAAKGAVAALHRALLESSSVHVITKRNPGILSPREGDANVLENDGFGSGSISCSQGIDHPEVSTCEFNLVK